MSMRRAEVALSCVPCLICKQVNQGPHDKARAGEYAITIQILIMHVYHACSCKRKKPFSTAKLENIPSIYSIVTDIELQTQQHFQFWYTYL